MLGTPGVLDGPTVMTARFQNRPTTLDVWHRRFGHMSIKTIRDALSKNLVNSLDIKGNLTVTGICEDCMYSKHAAWPYDAVVELERFVGAIEHAVAGRCYVHDGSC